MKRCFLISTIYCCLLQVSNLQAQSTDFPNAVHAKLNVHDYSALFNGNVRLGQGFEVAYFRNIAPFVNVGAPFKLGIAKLPRTTKNVVTANLDLVCRLENFNTDSKLIPFAFGGAGIAAEQSSKSHVVFPFGTGVSFRTSKYAYLTAQVEFRKALTDDRDNIQFGAGFVYMLHKSEPKPATKLLPAPPPADDDRDKDAITDATDKCPDEPGTARTLGCPDRDDDGVADLDDACPLEPGVAETGGCPDRDSDGYADKDDKCPDEAGRDRGCPEAKTEALTEAGTPAPADSDGDGIADANDPCPILAGSANGCPDEDQDGIADKDDTCPDLPGTAATKGCPEAPEVEATTDRDGDGFLDKNDACPNEAGTVQGCPDTDKDGLVDADDLCPDQPGAKSNRGCPEAAPVQTPKSEPVRDTDKDGVADKDDKCPNTPGLANNNGCPEVQKEVKERLAFATKAVQFETGKAVLKAQSFSILDEIVEIMRQYPAYNLAIAGHTDNFGDESVNLYLSTERAKACYDYLVFKGVKKERLRYVGFGEEKPIAPNNTNIGREINRRVEFEVTPE